MLLTYLLTYWLSDKARSRDTYASKNLCLQCQTLFQDPEYNTYVKESTLKYIITILGGIGCLWPRLLCLFRWGPEFGKNAYKELWGAFLCSVSWISWVIIIVYFELLVHINRIKIYVYKSILYQDERKLWRAQRVYEGSDFLSVLTWGLQLPSGQ